jgi:hypothetical protein
MKEIRGTINDPKAPISDKQLNSVNVNHWTHGSTVMTENKITCNGERPFTHVKSSHLKLHSLDYKMAFAFQTQKTAKIISGKTGTIKLKLEMTDVPMLNRSFKVPLNKIGSNNEGWYMQGKY